MPEVYLKKPPEMEKLLMKYRGGSVPPLVVRGSEEGNGLFSEELLDILKKGLSANYSIPLCISVIPDNHQHRIQRVSQARELPRQAISDLFSFCRCLRSIRGKGEEEVKMRTDVTCSGFCECCAERIASVMQHAEARAYMCRIGMVSFAVPVYVAGEIVAVLSAECRKPKEGAIWPESLVQNDAFSLSDVSELSSPKVDLWHKSKFRVQEFEKALELQPGELLEGLIQYAKVNPGIEILPEDLKFIMGSLESAGSHLSEMADKTYRLEKESVIGWLRAEMASALSSVDSFWEKIQWCFGNLAQLVGADYILLISREKSGSGPLHLNCQYGLSEEFLPALEYDWTGSMSHVDDLVKVLYPHEHIHEADLRQHRDVPILSMLYSRYGKGVGYPVLIAPTVTTDGRLIFMVLGKEDHVEEKRIAVHDESEKVLGGEVEAWQSQSATGDYHSLGMRWLREDDRRYLMTIVRELAIITNVFFSMRNLQETEEEQTFLMESVAHDLRTPIQNIMIAAENLRERRVSPERASHTITGVVTQLQRLNMLAQKAWTLEQIRLDKLIYNDEQMVYPYQVFVECKDLLIDMAERRSIDIHIETDLKNWQEIHVDVEMFRLVVLNLLHNGIKYSFPDTCIEIGGWHDAAGMGMAITFENEGIHIHDEEKDRIFERYFRSRDAVKMDPAGSGIGLALVKEFVDHYGGRIDVRSTEVGFGRYLNLFSLFLPGR